MSFPRIASPPARIRSLSPKGVPPPRVDYDTRDLQRPDKMISEGNPLPETCVPGSTHMLCHQCRGKSDRVTLTQHLSSRVLPQARDTISVES